MAFPPRYEPLSAVDKDDESEQFIHRRKPIGKKRFILYFLSSAALMCALFSATRLARSRGFWITCYGPQRNQSNLARLPSHYTLPSGDKIPSVALGVWQAGKGEVGSAVKTALGAGYRHIDGAWIYRNEAEVGQALQESDVPREQLWLTSKLWNTFHAPEDIEPVLDDSLSKLGTDYLDLYLIHWPIAFKKDGNNILEEDLTADPYPTWQKLEELVDKGKVRNIGISKVQNLTSNSLKYQPAVNQVELNFWNPQPELLKWSKENGLLLEAYSPLGSNKQVGESLAVPEVKNIACKLGITPAQVIISWHVQRGTVVLPKSVTPSRIVENFDVFEIPQEDFEKLERAAASHPPKRVVNPSKGWNLPFDVSPKRDDKHSVSRVAMSFQQHPDAPCLRFPENIGLHANVTIEAAANMLARAAQLSLTVPYSWTFIDKPVGTPARDRTRTMRADVLTSITEGQVVLIFLPNPAQPPNDGIRYQDQETRYALPVPGNREIEVMEIKYGFVPNTQETSAWRVRRRYRLIKGGHPHITLVHYTRGPMIQTVPSLMNSPVRQYPLRQINDPPVYVMGDKTGQKAYPPSSAPPPPQGPIGMSPQPMGMNQPGMGMVPQGMNPQAMGMSPQGIGMTQQAMLAQQNSNMESLERRRERERERARERSGSMGTRPGPPRLDDDDSADEFEVISTRTLALTRYKRNHELMEEVFRKAAFGTLMTPPPPPPAYSIFDELELESKVAKLQQEVEVLQAQAAERTARRSAAEDVIVASGHTPMEVSS
ncbi:NADP-dependent oxidoreductase domain-containing protein [Butyriboletus roseoflavus]|nr:NADP-dependent oxidoreductase domain-containing protein [Butyriboletus roseoflavus]